MAANRDLIKRYKQLTTGEVALPLCFKHAKGAYLYDYEGNSVLDFTSGYGVVSAGWLRKEIADAVHQQLLSSAYAPPWVPTKEAIELAELLLENTPANLVSCSRATSGAEANEIIFKAVFAYNGKSGILSFNRSYHGGTHFALAISETEKFSLPKLPPTCEVTFVTPPHCYRCPYGAKPDSCSLQCSDSVEAALKKGQIGSFFLEPVIGSGGVIITPEKYLIRIRELCSKYKVILVFDEVITGFGRLGALTASELYAVAPDAISFAKGISSGYAAIAAAVLNQELADALRKSEDVSSTFAWTPLSCCVAKTTIELIIKENLSSNAKVQGRYFLTNVKALFQLYLPEQTGEVRGVGLLIGIELVDDHFSKNPDKKLTQRFILGCFKQGLMVCASWDLQVIILMPPLNITREEIDTGLTMLKRVLANIALRNIKNRQRSSNRSSVASETPGT